MSAYDTLASNIGDARRATTCGEFAVAESILAACFGILNTLPAGTARREITSRVFSLRNKLRAAARRNRKA